MSNSDGGNTNRKQIPWGKPPAPASSPDDPVLIEHGRVLDLLCVGPIYGLSTGDLRSIYLDDVPAQNTDGSTNLKDIYFSIVNGYLDQPAIKGMSDIESEVTIQSKVTLVAPVTASVTNTQATSCRVKISVPALYNGAAGTSIAFMIETNANGAGWVGAIFPPGIPVGGYTPRLSVNGTTKAITRNIGSWIDDYYHVGQSVQTSGFTNAGNNQTGLVITTMTAAVLTFANASGLVTEAESSARYLSGTTLDGSLKGRFASKYIKAFRIPLTGTGPWQIRLTRFTPDSADPTLLQNDLYFESLTTIVEARLRYPYSAMAAVSVDAKHYSKIPARSYLMKLRIINVPRNYTPSTRVYATSGPGTTGGVWDGTFWGQWSDNPAWCFYDLAANARYGAGASLDVSMVDKWSLYTIGQYCDVLVLDGKGGTEPRFTCNTLINSRQEGIKLLNYMASVFRGMAYWTGGVITAIQDVDASPSALFTSSNVVDGKFSYSGTARRARHTACIVYWNDPANLYKRTPEYVEDQAGIARYGLNQIEITSFACTSQGQARRLGLWTLASELTETEVVTFATGMQGIVARPGEIIQVQDQFRNGTRAGGRLIASTTTQITLDAPVTLVGGVAYQISCSLPDGTVETKVVSTGATTTAIIDIGGAFTVAPQVQGQWVMIAGDDSMRTELYRIISISESDAVYAVTALLHNPDKYALIESGLVITPGTPIAFDPHSPVLGIVGRETLKDQGETLSLSLLATWTPRTAAIGYSAFASLNSGAWQPMTVSAAGAELENAVLGAYRIRVMAHYKTGISDYVEASYTVTGLGILGTSIVDLTTVYKDGQLRLQWDKINLVGVAYEIRVGAAWNSAQILGRTAESRFESVTNGTYWVAAIFANTYGIPSDVTVTGATLVKNVVQTWVENPTWPGTLSGGAFVSDGDLQLGGTTLCDDLVGDCDDILGLCDYLGGVAATGEYEVPASHIVDIGTPQPCSISSSYDFLAIQPSVTWDSIPGNWDSLVDTWWDGTYNNGIVSIRLYLAISQDAATWGAWQIFTPGVYVGRRFKMKMVLTSSDPTFTPIVSSWSWMVDMPDRIERFTDQSVSASVPGITLVFAIPFQIQPNVQVTIHDAAAQDTWIRDSISTTGVTGHVVNGAGTPVARTIDLNAQAY